MDYNKAKAILFLCEPFTEKDIRSAYYRQALKYHPDKNGGEEERFKNINSAYVFLQEYSNIPMEDNNLSYLSIIKQCIHTMLPDLQWNDLFVDTTMSGILQDCEVVSLEIFDHLSKEKSLEIYSFLVTYRDILQLSDELLQKMLAIIHRKSVHDNVVILNPNINDLLLDKIYKLEIFNRTFYVPLWHNEVVFDISGADLIVKNIPELDSTTVIDNHNNIHCYMVDSIQRCLLSSELTVVLGEKKYSIPASQLTIVREQTHILRNQGILLADHTDLYNTERRGHMYIHITLQEVQATGT